MARKARNKRSPEKTAKKEHSAPPAPPMPQSVAPAPQLQARFTPPPAAPVATPQRSSPAASTPQPSVGMRAQPPSPDAAAGARQAGPIVINAQYVKDASLEVPHAPRVFALMQKASPDISVNIDVRAQPIQENAFEVAFHVHAKCSVAETVAFIVEVVYAGLFTVNVTRELLEPTLLIECPRLLFPFARNIVADLTRDGGFPPLMLGPVDFTAMYQNQLQKRAASATAPAPAPSPAPPA